MPATWVFSYGFLARQASKTPGGRVAGPPGAARNSNRTHSGVLVAIRERKSGPPPAERATTPSSSSRRMGWRRLARPKGSQLFNLPYSYKPFSRKFGPSPVPLEAMQNPGWGAQRHRLGQRCEASRRTQPKLRPHAFLRAIPPRRGGRPVASPRDGSATFAPLICARAGDGPKNCSTQWSLAARLFPHSRLVETGGRRYPTRQAAIRRSTRRDCAFR